jgi:tRNA nucleotidyltransferase (CCA-adding enzyme)
MTTPLPEQFDDALDRIGITRTAAIAAHAEVRTRLEVDSKLREWGIDTILIGSYARRTSIHPCHDVDVFVKLTACQETNPEAVFSEVQRVLVTAYKDQP